MKAQIGLLSVTFWIAVFSMAGCKPGSSGSVIDHADIQFSDNLMHLKMDLVFSSDVTPNLSGMFPIKNYGNVFLNPATSSGGFTFGLDLDWVNLVNDQDYAKIEPTVMLPNGEPTGLGPLVQVQLDSPPSKAFEVYAYVDVKNFSWVGAAMIIDAVDQNIFPSGLTVSDVLKRDSANNVTMLAFAFGPGTNSDGSSRAGGIAFFANARDLSSSSLAGNLKGFLSKSHLDLNLQGPSAPYFRAHPEELLRVRKKLVKSLNALR